MALYTLPTFNITCDIYKGDPTLDFTLKVFRLTSPCQLRGWAKHPPFGAEFVAGGTGVDAAMVALLLPALTDIRDPSCNSNTTDVVEVPSGSGRWYLVGQVDDVAKGFANEYRRAALAKVFQGTFTSNYPNWPTPIT